MWPCPNFKLKNFVHAFLQLGMDGDCSLGDGAVHNGFAFGTFKELDLILVNVSDALVQKGLWYVDFK